MKVVPAIHIFKTDTYSLVFDIQLNLTQLSLKF